MWRKGRPDLGQGAVHPIRIVVLRGLRSGQYGVTAMDNRSRYPVTATLTVSR